MLFFIPQVLIVQSMVNKETFVVKVSIQYYMLVEGTEWVGFALYYNG